jgi:hypothetical protein
MAASFAMGLVRYAFELGAFASGLARAGDLIGLRQVPNVLSTSLLLAGVLAMWLAFSRYRMGLRFGGLHVAGFLLILSVAPVFFWFAGNLPDSRSQYAFVRVLQSLDPAMVFGCAVLALVLHSIRGETGKGAMGISLGYLIAALMVRPLAFALRLSLNLAHPVPAAMMIGLARGSDWLFALAVMRRLVVNERAEEVASELSDQIRTLVSLVG